MGVAGNPSFTAHDPTADIEVVSQGSRSDVSGQLPFKMCSPDSLSFRGPRLAIEERIEDYIRVQEDLIIGIFPVALPR